MVLRVLCKTTNSEQYPHAHLPQAPTLFPNHPVDPATRQLKTALTPQTSLKCFKLANANLLILLQFISSHGNCNKGSYPHFPPIPSAFSLTLVLCCRTFYQSDGC